MSRRMFLSAWLKKCEWCLGWRRMDFVNSEQTIRRGFENRRSGKIFFFWGLSESPWGRLEAHPMALSWHNFPHTLLLCLSKDHRLHHSSKTSESFFLCWLRQKLIGYKTAELFHVDTIRHHIMWLKIQFSHPKKKNGESENLNVQIISNFIHWIILQPPVMMMWKNNNVWEIFTIIFTIVCYLSWHSSKSINGREWHKKKVFPAAE